MESFQSTNTTQICNEREPCLAIDEFEENDNTGDRKRSGLRFERNDQNEVNKHSTSEISFHFALRTAPEIQKEIVWLFMNNITRNERMIILSRLLSSLATNSQHSANGNRKFEFVLKNNEFKLSLDGRPTPTPLQPASTR